MAVMPIPLAAPAGAMAEAVAGRGAGRYPVLVRTLLNSMGLGLILVLLTAAGAADAAVGVLCLVAFVGHGSAILLVALVSRVLVHVAGLALLVLVAVLGVVLRFVQLRFATILTGTFR